MKPLSKIIILLIVCFSTSFLCNGATFIVSSKLDSGEGTLRAAIENANANGVATVDYIFFNLPGSTATDLTITLIDQLPKLSSGLVIDATSQPGVFNFTHKTKVKISSPYDTTLFTIFSGEDIDNFQFYGLFLYDFSDEVVSRPALKPRVVVELKRSKNIIVGDGERGNLIRGGTHQNMIFEDCQNIAIMGNLFGWDTAETFTYHNPGLHFNNCDQINIGGSLPKEKNILFLSVFINVNNNSSITNAQIKGNNFGVLENENSPLWYIQGHGNFIYVRNTSGRDSVTPTVNLEVSNNVFWNQGIGVYIDRIKGDKRIVKNYFGITRSLVPMLKNGGTGTFLFTQGDQGKTRISDNYINVSYQAITALKCDDVQISDNKYNCTAEQVYKNFGSKNVLTQLAVDKFIIYNNLYEIKGTSDPNASIEVYDSEQCYAPTCRPRNRIGTVTADVKGDWQFLSSTNPITYFFSATSGAQSSEFKRFNIIEHINIEKAKCNEYGKVTGLEAYLQLNPKIRNSLGKDIPIDELNALPIGKYTISVDGACAESTFEIQLIIPVPFGQAQISTIDNSCGLTNGKIFINSFNGNIPIAYQWRNLDGKIVSETKELSDQPSGFYRLYGKDEHNCEQYIGNYEIKTIPEFQLLNNELTIKNDICGLSLGSISNLKIANGIGPFKFRWLNADNKEVGNNLNVNDLKAGIYHLIVNDSYCSKTYENFEVPLVGKVLAEVKQEDMLVCGAGDFTIQARKMENAAIYRLYNEDRTLLQENEAGVFNISISKPQKFLLSYLAGDCESLPTAFEVLFKQPEIKIPSAFSPNGDGINDTWKASDFSKYPSLSVLIYNRFGAVIYQGGRNSIPFDGRLNGSDLETGVYYYVIKLLPFCPVLSGSLTLVR